MPNEEQLRLLKQDVEAWNTWRQNNPGVIPDLRAADLRGADLRGADLSEADLRDADLSGADLSGTDRTVAKPTGEARRKTEPPGSNWRDDKEISIREVQGALDRSDYDKLINEDALDTKAVPSLSTKSAEVEAVRPPSMAL